MDSSDPVWTLCGVCVGCVDAVWGLCGLCGGIFGSESCCRCWCGFGYFQVVLAREDPVWVLCGACVVCVDTVWGLCGLCGRKSCLNPGCGFGLVEVVLEASHRGWTLCGPLCGPCVGCVDPVWALCGLCGGQNGYILTRIEHRVVSVRDREKTTPLMKKWHRVFRRRVDFSNWQKNISPRG